MEIVISFLVSVGADVVCHYIGKWLDRNRQTAQHKKRPRAATRGLFCPMDQLYRFLPNYIITYASSPYYFNLLSFFYSSFRIHILFVDLRKGGYCYEKINKIFFPVKHNICVNKSYQRNKRRVKLNTQRVMYIYIHYSPIYLSQGQNSLKNS